MGISIYLQHISNLKVNSHYVQYCTGALAVKDETDFRLVTITYK